ncbi:glutamate 5-kinase [Alkalihalobacillus hemicellulosilyticus]|uniref:Glutamate 5-kinase n=1 Tax=Halalkalibacter hemicellulosilyticusJCM 9152 TaxID=1236971 RepID=W4QHJ6_9BACI|nr:glutamate 5-kinase [Halalkalibacter hemicellulosilyticus]GAE30809.1 glutamate 5-kinase [Halalkalibacter hemicellulosilyticusJCM 9152]
MGRQRLVVKIGSSSLTTKQGALSMEKVSLFVEAIARLKQEGHEVIMISSGAVAAGFGAIGYPTRPITIQGKQAAAAVGQGLLMQAYIEQFTNYGLTPAQLLLTRQDFSDQTRYGNAYSTLTELLKRGAIPIINENDSISIEELTFGDNDMLSALVSGLIHARTLCLMTDVNGLYDANPQTNPQAKKIHFIPQLTDDLMNIAGESGSKVGTGGMKSKISAAKTALSLGVNVFIGKGNYPAMFTDILSGKGDGTYIGSFTHEAVMPMTKQWIALHSKTTAYLTVDQGAATALLSRGKSLLPVGIKQIEGTFNKGEVIGVLNEKHELIGKGKAAMTFDELISYQKTQQETRENEKQKQPVVIHRNEWVPEEKEKMKQ